MTKLLLGDLLGINVLAFLLYGFDKWKAKKNKWRIPEKGEEFIGKGRDTGNGCKEIAGDFVCGREIKVQHTSLLYIQWPPGKCR